MSAIPSEIPLASGPSLFNIVMATRDLSLIALVMVVYDYVAHFREEKRLIWTSCWSLHKFAFLVNRHMVPVCLALSMVVLSGYSTYDLKDGTCQTLIVALGACNFVSLAIKNGLMTMHVIHLWDSKPAIKYLTWIWYAIVYVVSFVFFIIGGPPKAQVKWLTSLHMCAPLKVPTLSTSIWGLPLSYDALLFIALIWNVVDRPRLIEVGILRSLRRDGIVFYAVMTGVRIIQMGFVSTGKSEYYLITNNIVWAIITVTLNYSMRSMQREELKIREQTKLSFPDRSSEMPVSTSVELTRRSNSAGRYSDGGYKLPGSTAPVHIETTIESFARS